VFGDPQLPLISPLFRALAWFPRNLTLKGPRIISRETSIAILRTYSNFQLKMSHSVTGTTSYKRRLPSGTSKTGRRQYHSCDQCRKGKRACDIVLSEESVSAQSTAPCSNCVKTRKSCTLVWLNSAKQSLTKGKERRNSGQDQQELADSTMARVPIRGFALENLDYDLQYTANEGFGLPISPPTHAFLGMPQEQCYGTGSTSSELLLNMTSMYGYETGSSGAGISNPGNICSPLVGTNSSFDGSIFSHNLTTPGNTSLSSIYEQATPSTERSPKRRRSRPSPSPGLYPEHTSETPSNIDRRKSLLCHTNSQIHNSTAHSSLSLEHRISLGYSKASISSGLVKIYHDSKSFLLLCRKIIYSRHLSRPPSLITPS